MVVDERPRHELYRRLEEVLGPDAATTLIEHLPAVGWTDVATMHDLAGLEQRTDLRFRRGRHAELAIADTAHDGLGRFAGLVDPAVKVMVESISSPSS